jgi:ABC-type nitrate/sulfonate/bicarbonate transport system ATPase subunit
MSAFIEVQGVSKAFVSGRVVRQVLHNVNLSVERGEFVSIVGSMGCGKSTFLSILSGLTAPDSGRVMVDGEVLRDIRPNAAIVFQNYSLLPWFSALENVRLAVGASSGIRRCDISKWSAWAKRCSGVPASYRAVCSNVWRSRAHSQPNPKSFFSTNRSGRSM